MDRTVAGKMALKAFWDLGENGWKADMDSNLLKLSIFTQGSVKDMVAAEPASPAEGDCYILDATHATHPNNVAAYDNGAWVYFAPWDGLLLWNVASVAFYSYKTAGGWAALATGGGGGATNPSLTAHRYWMVHFAGSKDFAISVAEIEMRATPGGADQCAGGTAISRAAAAGNPASSAFDNDATTFFSDQTVSAGGYFFYPGWIGYDFGAGNAKIVQEVAITARPSAQDQTPLWGRIMYSDDGLIYYTGWEFVFATEQTAGQTHLVKNPLA